MKPHFGLKTLQFGYSFDEVTGFGFPFVVNNGQTGPNIWSDNFQVLGNREHGAVTLEKKETLEVSEHYSHSQSLYGSPHCCVQLFETPRTTARQFSLSTEFSRQNYWNGLPVPSPGDLPNPEIEPGSPALQADSFTVWATREAPVRGKWILHREQYSWGEETQIRVQSCCACWNL